MSEFFWEILGVSSSESSDGGKEFPSGSEGYSDSNSSSNTRGKIIGKMRDNFRGAKKKGTLMSNILLICQPQNMK